MAVTTLALLRASETGSSQAASASGSKANVIRGTRSFMTIC
jgi:hypothetical protein